MDQAVRADRSGLILAAGIVSLVPLAFVGIRSANQWFFPSGLVAVPLGIAAIVMGVRQLRAARAGSVASGRARTRLGVAFGLFGSLSWSGLMAFGLITLSHVFSGDYTFSTSGADATHRTKTHYRGSAIVCEWTETVAGTGWVNDGHWRLRDPDHGGQILEDGEYSVGKRIGTWSYFHPDGSIDYERTGLYENDVLVRASASPKGDYEDEAK